MENKALTIADLRRILGISKSKAYSMIQCGEIKCFRIGRCIRVTESSLTEYIKAHSSNE